MRDWYQPARWANPLAVFAAVARADLVFGWFASWHTFWPIVFARLLGRPSILVIGGFDTANLPDIGYGFQQGGLPKVLSRVVMRAATHLVTNSLASRREIATNIGPSTAARVIAIHHGVPDSVGTLPPAGEREDLALSVGVVVRNNLERKGLRLFVEAARRVPRVRFVLAGRWEDSSIDELRGAASSNVTFTGWVADDELARLYRTASVYVQASRHEGFGMSVAEAMLAGCIPVVTAAGALPEVVGDTGVVVERATPDTVAQGVERGLRMTADDRRRARERVLREFPMEKRREGLWRVVDEALARDG